MAQRAAEHQGVSRTPPSAYGGKMNQYRDESDDVRVTETERIGHSNIPLDIEGLRRRIQEKVDAEIQKWAREYFGYTP